MMKANPAQALYVLIAVVIMYLIYRRTQMDLENYVKTSGVYRRRFENV